jgi:hypothetical protein
MMLITLLDVVPFNANISNNEFIACH